MNEFKENSKKLGDIMDDFLFKKLEELEYRIVQLENQNKGLVWEEVEEMPKPEITNATYTD